MRLQRAYSECYSGARGGRPALDGRCDGRQTVRPPADGDREMHGGWAGGRQQGRTVYGSGSESGCRGQGKGVCGGRGGGGGEGTGEGEGVGTFLSKNDRNGIKTILLFCFQQDVKPLKTTPPSPFFSETYLRSWRNRPIKDTCQNCVKGRDIFI